MAACHQEDSSTRQPRPLEDANQVVCRATRLHVACRIDFRSGRKPNHWHRRGQRFEVGDSKSGSEEVKHENDIRCQLWRRCRWIMGKQPRKEMHRPLDSDSSRLLVLSRPARTQNTTQYVHRDRCNRKWLLGRLLWWVDRLLQIKIRTTSSDDSLINSRLYPFANQGLHSTQ